MAAFPVNSVTAALSTDTWLSNQVATTRPPTQTAATESTQHDTVTLSPTAEALQLYRDGESVTAIAATLGANIASVDGYLDLPIQDFQTTEPSRTYAASSAKI